MIKYISIITLLTLINLTALANDNNHDNNPSDSNSEESTAVIHNAFYSNTANDMIFIDFADIRLNIKRINLIQNDQTVMEEDVETLPQNAIHEIDLTLFEKGNYIVELVIQDEITIRKNIVVN